MPDWSPVRFHLVTTSMAKGGVNGSCQKSVKWKFPRHSSNFRDKGKKKLNTIHIVQKCFPEMGGNALTEGLTERKDLSAYLEIKEVVLSKLESKNDSTATEDTKVIDVVSEIIEMPEKLSFGDLDLLYVSSENKGKNDLYATIAELFSPTEIVTHGSVTSFDFMKFQIDLIKCTHETFGMSRFCLSYGDRGMILGQMAKCRGFSLGVKGLIVTHSNVEALLGCSNKVHLSSKSQIVLSTDPIAIAAFMGLQAEQHLETQQDVVDYCMQSTWFHPKCFTPRRLNNCEGKKKLRLRPFYKMFCDKIAADFNLADSLPPSDEDRAGDLSTKLSNIREGLRLFGRTECVEETRLQLEGEQEVREKMNHRRLLALGIEGRRIGAARGSFEHWLLDRHGSNIVRSGNKSCSRSGMTALQTVVLGLTDEQVQAEMNVWFLEEWQQQQEDNS